MRSLLLSVAVVNKTVRLRVLNCVVDMGNFPLQTSIVSTEFVNDEDNISGGFMYRDVVLRDQIINLLVHRNFPEIVTISIISDCPDHLPTKFLVIWLPGWRGISLCCGPSDFPSLQWPSVISAQERKC